MIYQLRSFSVLAAVLMADICACVRRYKSKSSNINERCSQGTNALQVSRWTFQWTFVYKRAWLPSSASLLSPINRIVCCGFKVAPKDIRNLQIGDVDDDDVDIIATLKSRVGVLEPYFPLLKLPEGNGNAPPRSVPSRQLHYPFRSNGRGVQRAWRVSTRFSLLIQTNLPIFLLYRVVGTVLSNEPTT